MTLYCCYNGLGHMSPVTSGRWLPLSILGTKKKLAVCRPRTKKTLTLLYSSPGHFHSHVTPNTWPSIVLNRMGYYVFCVVEMETDNYARNTHVSTEDYYQAHQEQHD